MTSRSVSREPELRVTLERNPELLVKSAERVRDLGEVFTPVEIVEDMLDLLPADMWAVHPAPNYLEPACGDGNFLVAILARKLAAINAAALSGALPAGAESAAVEFHALEALASIYAVDISVDNIVGGTPGHEVGARSRLLNIFTEGLSHATGKKLSQRSHVMQSAEWVVTHNVIVGNMLAIDGDGKPTGRDELPLIVYEWSPGDQKVSLAVTTIGDVAAEADDKTDQMLDLFGPAEPRALWTGSAARLHAAERVETPELVGRAINGKGSHQ